MNIQQKSSGFLRNLAILKTAEFLMTQGETLEKAYQWKSKVEDKEVDSPEIDQKIQGYLDKHLEQIRDALTVANLNKHESARVAKWVDQMLRAFYTDKSLTGQFISYPLAAEAILYSRIKLPSSSKNLPYNFNHFFQDENYIITDENLDDFFPEFDVERYCDLVKDIFMKIGF